MQDNITVSEKKENNLIIFSVQANSAELCYSSIAGFNKLELLFQIENKSHIDLKNFKIRIKASSGFILGLDNLITGNVKSVDSPYNTYSNIVKYNLDSTAFRDITEDVTESLSAVLFNNDDEIISEKTVLLTIKPMDYWNGNPVSLPVFVERNSPVIKRLVQNVSEALKKISKNSVLNAYQSNDETEVLKQCAAIYSVLQEQGLIYSVPLSNEALSGQRIRNAEEILTYKSATCLDLTLLYCAIAENIGLHPLICIIPGHAFPAVWLKEDKLFNIVYHMDSTDITQNCTQKNQSICVLEATAITSVPLIPFEKAREMGLDNAESTDSVGIVDIRLARELKIKPLPQKIKTDTGEIVFVEDETFSHSLNTVEEVDNYVFDSFEAADNAPKTKIEAWQRSLIDFSTRSPLISVKISPRFIQVLHYSIEDLEDGLFKGESYQIIPSPLETTDVSLQNQSVIRANAGLFVSYFKQNKIVSAETEKELQKKLTGMYRKVQTELSETGANSMYLSAGLIEWTDNRKKYFAPLLLYPVNLIRKNSKTFEIKLREDQEAELNFSIFEKFRTEFNYATALNYEELPTDENGLDVRKIFEIIREELKKQSGWRLLETCILGLFSFGEFVMWNDMRKKSEKLAANKIVSSLINGELSFKPKDMTQVSNEDFVKEVLPVSLDESQLMAVKAAGSGCSFILQGPPGTGKSQTIIGIIVDAITKGKKVLFVAEKMAALQVVYRKLKQVGMSSFLLELHSTKITKSHFIEQMRIAMERSNVFKEPDNRKKDRISKISSDLNSYVDIINEKQDCGLTLYQLINKADEYKNVRKTDLSYLDIKNVTEEDLEELYSVLKTYSREIKTFLPLDKHPFRMLKLTSFSEEKQTSVKMELSVFSETVFSLQKELSLLNNSLIKNIGGGVIAGETEKNKQNDEPALASYFGEDGADRKTDSGFYGIADRITPDGVKLLAELYNRIELLHSLKFSVSLMKTDVHEFENSTQAILEYQNILNSSDRCAMEDWQSKALNLNIPSLLREWSEIKTGLFKKGKRRDFLKDINSYRLRDNIDEYNLETELRSLASLIDTEGRISASLEKVPTAWRPYLDYNSEDFNRIKENLSNLKVYAKKVSGLFGFSEKNGTDVVLLEYLYANFENLKNTALLNEKLLKELEKINSVLILDSYIIKTPLQEIRKNTDFILQNSSLLFVWADCNNYAKHVKHTVYGVPFFNLTQSGMPLEDVYEMLKASYYKTQIEGIVRNNWALKKFDRESFEDTVLELSAAQKEYREQILTYVPGLVEHAFKKDIDSSLHSQMQEVRRFVISGGRRRSIRSLFDTSVDYITNLCPCMLMSPLSVAQFLEPGKKIFDLVVFDEASQIQTAKAIGSIARGEELIVVGDSKQMPPTNFFKKSGDAENEEFSLDSERLKDLDSILDDCNTIGLPDLTLNWHYRSASESLIDFSNKHYYYNRLKTYPSVDAMHSKVIFNKVDGYYEASSKEPNVFEADAIVSAIRQILKDPVRCKNSIGVITFNEKQQNLIIRKLDELFERNADLAKTAQWYDDEVESPDKLIVKNLENIQGDERDIIMLSVTFGPGRDGRMSYNFGPINKDGGEKRLNVAFSRAKKEMQVFTIINVSSFNPDALQSRGPKDLRDFLIYASKKSSIYSAGDSKETIREKIAKRLYEEGFECSFSVGLSDFKIDIAVKQPQNKDLYFCGIMLDGPNITTAKLATDRFVLRRDMLKTRGWRVIQVRIFDLYSDFEGEMEYIIKQVNDLYGVLLEEEKLKEAKIAEEMQKNEQTTETDNISLFSSGNVPEIGGDTEINVVKTAFAGAYQIAELDYTPVESAKIILQDTSIFEAKFKAVIETEGPVLDDYLQKRVLHSFGVKKRGKNIKPFLEEILAKMNVFTTKQQNLDGETQLVYWQDEWKNFAGNLETEYIKYRTSIGADKEACRDITEIPHIEIRNVMVSLIKEKGGYVRNSLIDDSAKKLGFKRTGDSIKSIMNYVFDKAVESGLIFEYSNSGLVSEIE